ncbi:MAG: DMT family transporter [Methylococcales bacterium]|nr:DMT family transporter [Methylococcales bacterium]
MRIKLAYLGVVLVWTTTPLSIKWSGEEFSYVLGVTARMSIGILCLLVLMLAYRQRLSWRRVDVQTYLAVTLQLYLSMFMTYWAAQFVPSGWISVLFGLSPFMTAFMAAAILKEQSLGRNKIFAYLLGVAGLMVMCLSAWDLNRLALLGVAGILAATIVHSFAAVLVKRIDAGLPAVQQITGGLLFSLPLYYLSWYAIDHGQLPPAITDKTLYAIVYLGVIATTLGLIFYYYILRHLPATKVAMINLMTPVLSLFLGYAVNNEALTLKVAIGAGLIMAALLMYQLADQRQRLEIAE